MDRCAAFHQRTENTSSVGRGRVTARHPCSGVNSTAVAGFNRCLVGPPAQCSPGLTKGISVGHEYCFCLASSHRVWADRKMDLRVPSMSIGQTWQSEYQGYTQTLENFGDRSSHLFSISLAKRGQPTFHRERLNSALKIGGAGRSSAQSAPVEHPDSARGNSTILRSRAPSLNGILLFRLPFRCPLF